MKITARPVSIRGEKKWVINRTENGKRKRQFFATRSAAEDAAAVLRDQIENSGRVWFELSAREKQDILSVVSEIKASGLTLRGVWAQFQASAGHHSKPTRTLAEAVKETIEAKEAALRRPKYVKSLREYLAKFIAGRENLHVDRITPAEIEQWFVSRKESPTTRESNLGRLSSMFGLCYRRNYIPFNPCDKVERVTVSTGRPKVFTAEESRRLVETCLRTDKLFLPYLVLGLFAGLRPEEAQKMKWENIDLKKHRIEISENISKVHEWRHVPIEPNAAEWLKLCDQKKPLIPNLKTLRRRRRRLVARAKLKWHQDILRKTAASYWTPIHGTEKVSEWLGNSARILRKRYRDLKSEEEAKEFWSIRPRSAVPKPESCGNRRAEN